MDLPADFGRLLDEWGRTAATLREWREWHEPAFHAVRPLLRPTGELAPFVRSTLVNGPLMRVAMLPSGSFVAVCPDQLVPDHILEPDSLSMWQLDEKRVRQALSQVLGLEPSANSKDGTLLGLTPSTNGDPVLVHLVWETTARNESLRIHELLACHAGPMLLLTPTGADWNDDLILRVQHHRSSLESLSKHAVLNTEGWVHGPDWIDAVQTARTQLKLRRGQVLAIDGSSQFRLVRASKAWLMTFRGRSFALSNSEGVRLLRNIIEFPNRTRCFLEVKNSFAHPAARLGIPAGERADVDDSLAGIEKRVREIHGELGDAKRCGNSADVTALEAERLALAAEAKSLVSRQRRRMNESKKHRSARVAFASAVRKAIDEIASADSEAGDHFRECVNASMDVSYTPPSGVRWDF